MQDANPVETGLPRNAIEVFREETVIHGVIREGGILLPQRSVTDAGISVRSWVGGSERLACRSGLSAAVLAACVEDVGAVPAAPAGGEVGIPAGPGETPGLGGAAVRRQVMEWLEAVEDSVLSRHPEASCRVGCDERIRRIAVHPPGGPRRDRTDRWATVRIAIRFRDGSTGGRFHAGGERVAELIGRLDPAGCADSAWTDGLAAREAVPPPADAGLPVVFAGAPAATLFHEICGHALEADLVPDGSGLIESIRAQRSIPADLRVFDDPTVSGFGGSRRIDDEGSATGRVDLVREGRVAGLLVDGRSARRRRLPSTGSGMRASYRDRPLVRLGNLFVRGGRGEPGEAIGSCSDGILVEAAGRGSLDPGGGFTLAVDRARRIRAGKAGRPLRPFLLIGSVAAALGNIEVLESDAAVVSGTGACSKEGQWLLVGQSAPPMRIAGLGISPGWRGHLP